MKKSLLSEDSLIINDFLENGLKAYISSSIKVNYISRKSFINILDYSIPMVIVEEYHCYLRKHLFQLDIFFCLFSL